VSSVPKAVATVEVTGARVPNPASTPNIRKATNVR
jgi:hypothetical protein